MATLTASTDLTCRLYIFRRLAPRRTPLVAEGRLDGDQLVSDDLPARLCSLIGRRIARDRASGRSHGRFRCSGVPYVYVAL